MPIDYFAALRSTGEPLVDIARFLAPRRPDTWQHVQAVARAAEELACRFGADVRMARLAGHAHDLAAVVPHAEIIPVAESWGVPLSEADRAIPQVVHGPLAAAVLHARLGVKDEPILDAVRYHTTLRQGAALLEKIVFLADKLAYDPTTSRVDYLPALQTGLERSLDAAAYAYLDFVVSHQAELGWRLHPRLLAAHAQLEWQRISLNGCAGATSP